MEPVHNDMKDNRHLINNLLVIEETTETIFADAAEVEQRRMERIVKKVLLTFYHSLLALAHF